MKNGIDASKWQGHIDWPRVKVDFAILRAGISTATDVRFEENYAGATAAGIPVGVYWYLRAMTVEAAHREADACIKAISGKKMSYPVYADIEEASQLKLGRQADRHRGGVPRGRRGGGIFRGSVQLQVAPRDVLHVRDPRAVCRLGTAK